MSTRGPKVNTIKAARDKEKRKRKLPSDDKIRVEPIVVKSNYRRMERKK